MGIITTVLAIGFGIVTGLQWHRKKRYLVFLSISLGIFLIGSMVDAKIKFKYFLDSEPKKVVIPVAQFSEVGYWKGSLDILNKEAYFTSRRSFHPPFTPLIEDKFWRKQLAVGGTTEPGHSGLIESNIFILLPELRKYPFRENFVHNIDYAYATYKEGAELFSFIEIKYQSQLPEQDSSNYLWRRLIFNHDKKTISQMQYSNVDKYGFLVDFSVNTAVFAVLLFLTTMIKGISGLKKS